jgi:hypothetical protein
MQIFLFPTSRSALGLAQLPIQWVQGDFFPRVKRPGVGDETEHSPPSGAEVKNAWNYTSTPSIRLHGMVLS